VKSKQVLIQSEIQIRQLRLGSRLRRVLVWSWVWKRLGVELFKAESTSADPEEVGRGRRPMSRQRVHRGQSSNVKQSVMF